MADLTKLVAEKNKQRSALKKEFWKMLTNPNSQGQGHVLDPAILRMNAMRTTRIDHFRETPKNLFTFIGLYVVPFALAVYFIKNHREEKEAAFRSGLVAYEDRQFKFQ